MKNSSRDPRRKYKYKMTPGTVKKMVKNIEIDQTYCSNYSEMKEEEKNQLTCDNLKKLDGLLSRCSDHEIVKDYYTRYVNKCNYKPITDENKKTKERLDAFFFRVR